MSSTNVEIAEKKHIESGKYLIVEGQMSSSLVPKAPKKRKTRGKFLGEIHL